jgi:stringent starvation protein B
MANPPPDKHELMLKLLEHSSVFMHLDPRREGVVVPLHFRSNPQLVLQIGLNFPIPSRDLKIDATGVRCTLSFNRQPFYCIVPWSSVYALVDEDGQVTVWPSELPPELMQPNEAPTAAGTQAVRSRKPKDKSTSTKKPPRTSPSLVESAPSDRSAPAAGSTAQPAVAVAASKGSMGNAASPERSSGDAPKRFTRSGREVPPWLRVVK